MNPADKPTWHPLLLRQLRRAGLTAEDAAAAHPRLPNLLLGVSRAYAEAEQDRYLMERSQEVASREMSELHAHLNASKARLASLVSLSSDWVWEQDESLRFSYVSALQTSHGIDLAQSLTGRQPDADLPSLEEDGPTYRARVAARQPFRNLRFRLDAAGARTLYFRISGEPVFEGSRFCGYRGVGTDVTDATLAEQKVLHLARYDSLTGLPNRGMFLAQIESAVGRAHREGSGLAVLFIDLDRFKAINDTLGHQAGDELLKVMARRLAGLLRSVDIAGRLGGDEFVVILDRCTDPAVLSKVASRLLGTLSEPLRLSNRTVQVGASVGIGIYPGDAADATALLSCADAAMYLAKSRGKNNFQFFTAQLAQRAAQHFALEGELRLAVEREELRLHYQPRFRIADGRLCGMEALLRWQHPQRGLVGPSEFMQLAEESGLIVPIGRWVMQEACRQIRSWREAGLDPPPCAINLSVRQFGNDLLVDELREAMAAAVLEGSAVEIEITESLFIADPERAQRMLEAIRALKVGIAIDDFGTGYSSLAYLKRFPAQTLKIDRSFVGGLPDSLDDAAITKAVIAMAHSMKMQVVAEGIETQAQLDFLRQHGCDEAQGFLLARPLPPDQLASSLERDVPQPADG